MTAGYRGGDPRMVKLAELWERVSAKGTRYFSGFLGGCQVLMFDGGEQPHPTKPGETVHVWRLMVQERDPARRPQARDAGGASGDRPQVPTKPSARPAQPRDGWRGSPRTAGPRTAPTGLHRPTARRSTRTRSRTSAGDGPRLDPSPVRRDPGRGRPRGRGAVRTDVTVARDQAERQAAARRRG